MIVMEGYFPGKKYGGPPVSIENFCALLPCNTCYIVTHDHDLYDTSKYVGISDGWNNRENCQVLYLSDKEYVKRNFEKIILEIQPEIIYLQGLFQACVLPCLQLCKKYKIPTLLAPRGELCDGAIKIRKYKKLPYIKLIRILNLTGQVHFQSTSSEETAALHKWLKIDDKHIHMLENVPSIPQKEIIKKEKKSGEGRFVFISRIHPKKNLKYVFPLLKDINGNVIFDIYGPIEDQDYWKTCQEEIGSLPSNVSVEYRGIVSHNNIHAVFSNYDAFIFPTLSENYGHVIAESMLAGTPVITSDQTPWNDINECGMGWALDLRDTQLFKKVIQDVISLDANSYVDLSTKCKEYAYSRMNIDELKSKYKSVLNRLLEGESYEW